MGSGSGFLELSEKDRAQAVAALTLAHKAKLCLSDLVQNAIDATKILGSPEKLPEAANYWQQRKGNIKAVLVTDAITELLKAKEQGKVSAVHHKDLRLRLQNGFSEKFGLVNVGDLDMTPAFFWGKEYQALLSFVSPNFLLRYSFPTPEDAL